MGSNFLAFDLGATSGRAIIGTVSDDKFSSQEIYRFPNGVKESEGKYYWDIDSLFGHFKAALRKVRELGIEISSIGVDTWGVDFGCIGSDGRILGEPRAYRDPYTDGTPEEVFKVIPRTELYDADGLQIMNFNSIFQIYAQHKDPASSIHKAKHILFMPDLMSYFLTGNQFCEYTIASTSGMIDPRTRNWDRSLLDRLGCDSSILLDLVQPGTKVGVLKKDLQDETGLGPIPVVAVAGHDTASAIAAVPAADEKFAYLSSGTWSLMGIESTTPIINGKSLEYNITNEGGIDGTTRFLKNITGFWLLEQSRKTWEREGRKYNYAQIEEMGWKAIDFPMISCIYHSLTKRYVDVIAMLQGFASFKIEKLHVIGGGSANKLLSTLTANALGIPVIAGPVEGTAIGNVMLQAKAAGLVKDRWEMRRIIANSIETKTYLPE